MAAAESGGYRAVFLKSNDDKAARSLHLLPCSVDYDGSAKTNSYFVPVRKADDTYEANFRGRRLCGRRVVLPETFSGHVLGSVAASQSVERNNAFEEQFSELQCAEDLELHTIEGFGEIVVWDHDRVPLASDDEFIGSLAWLDVATSIHADCSTDVPGNAVRTTNACADAQTGATGCSEQSA
ncbi:hypothetical protein H4R20_001324 [Coemansia guatemalensis]|uniref:Uncharacterized protein n=1 Tax=Coemansia guatemalensis TaxID=2761395 RepID=A0A9W8LVR5_9FUNG|nr:hypothetical protein H4R20_001324 [Coemansia guatemalensis]